MFRRRCLFAAFLLSLTGLTALVFAQEVPDEDKAISEWIRELKSEDAETRAEAARTLGRGTERHPTGEPADLREPLRPTRRNARALQGPGFRSHLPSSTRHPGHRT